MKTLVNLPKAAVAIAIDARINILQRQRNKESNLLICEIIEKDIAELQTAVNTLTETK